MLPITISEFVIYLHASITYILYCFHCCQYRSDAFYPFPVAQVLYTHVRIHTDCTLETKSIHSLVGDASEMYTWSLRRHLVWWEIKMRYEFRESCVCVGIPEAHCHVGHDTPAATL